MIYARPEQELKVHLHNVSELCRNKYYTEFCEFLGYFHDVGKSRNEWQEYLLSNIMGSWRGKKIGHAEHSANWIFKNITKNEKIKYSLKLAYVLINSHHTKNLNFDVTPSDINDIIETEFDTSKLKLLKEISETDFKNKLFIRYCFSCLIDSDITDCQLNGGFVIPSFDTFNSVADEFFKKYNTKYTNVDGLNFYRKEIFESCSDTDSSVGMYSLNVPTGGGKTLSSIAFALKKAINTNADRIFVVLPFNTLVKQTTNVLEEYFPGMVIDIHSQTDFSKFVDICDEDVDDIQKTTKNCVEYISDTFNGKIIVTTHVAFLESVFGRNYRRFRRLENSVIIFDEVQAYGLSNTKLLIDACEHLTHFGTSSVISTATQLDYNIVFKNDYRISNLQINDILLGKDYTKFFDRNTFIYVPEQKQYSDMCEYVHDESTLFITNVRKQAKELYKTLHNKYGDCVFHMSKNMMRVDLDRVLSNVKQRLIANEKVILVSTNLIEAGVDVDFKRVVRFMCGIPSIVQSAGRCNRNMKQTSSESLVYIVECALDDEQGLRNMSNTFNIESLIAKEYLKHNMPNLNDMLKHDANKFKDARIKSLLDNDFRKDFNDTNITNIGDLFRRFRAIENDGFVSIYHHCSEVLNELHKFEIDYSVISKYRVEISKSKLKQFEKYNDKEIYLFTDSQYDKDFGIKDENDFDSFVV